MFDFWCHDISSFIVPVGQNCRGQTAYLKGQRSREWREDSDLSAIVKHFCLFWLVTPQQGQNTVKRAELLLGGARTGEQAAQIPLYSGCQFTVGKKAHIIELFFQTAKEKIPAFQRGRGR